MRGGDPGDARTAVRAPHVGKPRDRGRRCAPQGPNSFRGVAWTPQRMSIFISCGSLPLSVVLHDCGTLVLRGTLCGCHSPFLVLPDANAGDWHAH